VRTAADAVTRSPVLIGACLIVGLACGLYLPFLANPPVFDDQGFFSGRLFSYYATHPFGLELRVPPYFSLAIVQVIWGSMEAHRLVSLALHVVCALALYKLIFDLQHYTQGAGAPQATGLAAHVPAFLAATVFAIHPVAVYGAGYLIQRMTVLATLFSLLSVILYLRGLARRAHADAISAAVLYSIAVLSRETAVLLPAAAVAAGLAVAAERRYLLRYTGLFAACCAPAAALVALLVKGKIGTAYEPDFEVVSAQIAGTGAGPGSTGLLSSPWLESAVTQAGLFFRYLASWIWLDTGAMSIDVRVAFAGSWPLLLAVLAAVAFLGHGLLGLYLLRREGLARMAGFGLLFPWIMFLVEFTTIRYQEPFVLYRSYAWAPGLMVLLAVALRRLDRRGTIVFCLLALPLLFLPARDRLQTFSSGLALWEDAVGKLPQRAVPGGSRTLYNLGREYLYREQLDKAIAVTERCIADYPTTFDCYSARAAIHLQQEQYREAMPYLARAIELRPDAGAARHHLGIALENLGCVEEAKQQYRLAFARRFPGAIYNLERLEKPGTGLLPPVSSKAPTEACWRELPRAETRP